MEKIPLSQNLLADLVDTRQESGIIPANGADIGQSEHLCQNLSAELLQTGQENEISDILKNGLFWEQFWGSYYTQNTVDNNVLTIKNVPTASIEGV